MANQECRKGKGMESRKKRLPATGIKVATFTIFTILHAFKMRFAAKFFCLFFALAATAHAAVKPYPRGIMDLPGAISAKEPIGTLSDHPWENPNVDGLRIRTGWDNTEPADNVYNWVQIDECLANALASGKFIGLGVISGFDAPSWLLGGVTFTDGSSTLDVATLSSSTAAFVSSDVGKVIASDNYESGTMIVSVISSTVVKTSTAPPGLRLIRSRPFSPFWRANLGERYLGCSVIQEVSCRCRGIRYSKQNGRNSSWHRRRDMTPTHNFSIW